MPEDFAAHQSQQDVVVRPVTTRKELALFIRLPRKLYRHMKGYVAPLDLEQKDLIDPGKNPVFRHASIRFFIAWRGSEPCGRIAAIVDPIAIKTWNEKIGLFGAFDAAPQADIVSALLDAARDWLRLQGMARMRGPVTLSCHGESGLMIEGQDEPPMIATPWHPKALFPLVEAYGLSKVQDLLTYRLVFDESTDARHIVPQTLRPGEGRLGDISTLRLSKKEIAAQGEVLRELYNDGWAGTFNFVPLQSYEMTAMINQLKPLLRPEHYVQINQGNNPVAMAMVVPNVFDIVSDLGGAPSPLGWLKLGARLVRHQFRTGRVILLGVSQQMRGTVLGALMPSLAIAELLSRRDALPYDAVELGWILESNMPMRNLVERLVPTPNKVHRLYEGAISPNAA
ncbi:hypothetical protein AA101099_0834 [Neoasaia chiangmaiensis NBRC 101099]|uniref:Uncharacterized protein n=1 Tax=Neoasaia chiangmaiensis TaxID=320497 RepID=A0A1U9KMG9_9PROT|nr:hypothetical protein [Neoasaia chiangmaiensis]AQS86958.1 hypothetical protein A0U93_02240 [Neoasaia chiangmaiensis]GBR37688.1 hypothetical protein AA101099_0834 [Neoasaia chiangmaiensis NBRC 101099]GEN15072.1 DNA-binding protein [Neoasaia chiangmaiensis]